MDKAEILHIIALAVQPHISRGCSAGWSKDSASIRITDNIGREFVVTVTEEIKKPKQLV